MSSKVEELLSTLQLANTTAEELNSQALGCDNACSEALGAGHQFGSHDDIRDLNAVQEQIQAIVGQATQVSAQIQKALSDVRAVEARRTIF